MVGSESVKRMVATSRLDELGLDADLLCGRLGAMAEAVPAAAERVVTEASGIACASQVGPALVQEISSNCRRTLGLL